MTAAEGQNQTTLTSTETNSHKQLTAANATTAFTLLVSGQIESALVRRMLPFIHLISRTHSLDSFPNSTTSIANLASLKDPTGPSFP